MTFRFKTPERRCSIRRWLITYTLSPLDRRALTVSGLGIVAITWISDTHTKKSAPDIGANQMDIFFQVSFETVTLAITDSIWVIGCVASVSRLIGRSAGLAFVFERRTGWPSRQR